MINQNWKKDLLNKIHNVNCMEIINQLPDNSIKGIITDFPYGIDFQSNMRVKTEKFKKIANDKKPYVEWIMPSFEIIQDGGFIITAYRWDVQEALIDEFERSGFSVKSQVIWYKNGGGMGDLDGSFQAVHECFLFATKGKYKFPNGRPSTFYQCNSVPNLKMVHPNEKPVELMRALVRDLTTHEDIIFEPFSGSGSTSLACKIERREFIACDLDSEHVETGIKRLKDCSLSSLF